MRLRVSPATLRGRVTLPASKSHTIRALLIASLADGDSVIRGPLVSRDTLACAQACRALGAQISLEADWAIRGVGGRPAVPEDVIDAENSGTTANLVAGAAALGSGYTVLTGDGQLRCRPMEPLLQALNRLGAEAFSSRGNGRLPVVIRGPLKGGNAEVSGRSSQYLSSLLLSCPLADGSTELAVDDLHERPYVEMTLSWLQRQGIRLDYHGLEHFSIPGGQGYQGFDYLMPADFSSATFFLCAAALPGSCLTLTGLDLSDSQGDKQVIDMLRQMEGKVRVEEEGITVEGGGLKGVELDLKDTPDALPALAVVGCLAGGTTILRNCPQARIKETDRIAVMGEELARMGARIEELPDGLMIRHSRLRGARVSGHGDHRVVMSLAIAGLAAEGTTEVETAEAMDITFPNFVELMNQLGAGMELIP